MTRLRGERLRDAEAVHKCYQDLTDALAHIEVKINRKISSNVNFISAFSMECSYDSQHSYCWLQKKFQ